MVIQKYIIDLNGSKVDVTNRGCILWGCGEFAADIVKNYELENISFVVDGNSAKVGEIVCFGGKNYTVKSPDVLQKLERTKYYIMVASLTYKDEIVADILKKFGGETFPVCKLIWNRYICVHNKLEDIVGKAVSLNPQLLSCRQALFTRLRKVSDVLADYLNIGEHEYILLSKSSPDRINFFIDKAYHVKLNLKSFPSKANARAYLRELHECDNDLLIYDNDDCGLYISRYANPDMVDLSNKEDVMVALYEMRKLHAVNATLAESNLIRFDLKTSVEFYKGKCYMKGIDFQQVMAENLKIIINSKEIINEIDRHGEVIIHGDFQASNLVKYLGCIRMIDWDSIALGDPMVDLASLLIHDSSWFNDDWHTFDLLDDCHENITAYLQREPTRQELYHFYCVAIYVAYRTYLTTVQHSPGLIKTSVNWLSSRVAKLQACL